MSNIPATLLIVDDDVQIRSLLDALLQDQGYRTLTASSGEQALATVAQQPPDLILLDATMPGIDGYQVARRLKANPSTANIPIIMLSGQGEQSARLLGLEAGVRTFSASRYPVTSCGCGCAICCVSRRLATIGRCIP